MRFQVPQFIEVEDKIFGPLTVTQFIYVAGGIGFLVALVVVLPVWLGILLGAPFALLGLALAFYQINERPFIVTLQAGLEYLTKDKLYIWNKGAKKAPEPKEVRSIREDEDVAKYVPAATASKIKDLAWSLDIKESIYSDAKQK